ncbi:MerR family transcriptional regulator [Phenylobacterium sp. J367]|uniref:MerR family transcriptional regulator n=1 Tax=Phenylobacterium sp. J367 TaxID=2898435 RepID=UPI0021514BE0|nr:MerR family transcriptional regulator [Phenylobacterium sp. J367]MCR5881073.1 MerR family transcriptional regulator [Phenylobacterium sp. J367]
MTLDNLHHLPRLGLSNAMRVFGMTARALRFYEEKGLIEARRDRFNARYYDPVARERLAWIARLRRANVSLPDIEAVLNAEDDAALRAAAKAKLAARREAPARSWPPWTRPSPNSRPWRRPPSRAGWCAAPASRLRPPSRGSASGPRGPKGPRLPARR